MSEILIKEVNFAGGGIYNVRIKENLICGIEKVAKENIAKVAKENDNEDYGNMPVDSGAKIIDGRGKVLLPGLINMHSHSSMTLMRGAREDDKLQSWLKAIWKMESKLDPEIVYWGTKLACLEMIKTGTTCFFDEYLRTTYSSKAAMDMSLRSFHGYEFLNFFNKSKIEECKAECICKFEESKSWDSIAKFMVSIHSPYSVSPELIVWAAGFARENGLLLNIHLSETEKEVIDSITAHGLSPVAYLDKLGVLGSNVVAAHSLWLSDEDIEILGKHHVTTVHNINSNLKLSSGYKFRYLELKEAGANVCIGTDGCASSNNLDLLEAMKTAAMVQKAWRGDPTVMPINELLDIATVNAAKVLGLNLGKIEIGEFADLILIDTQNYAFTPNINFYANLIYSANSSCVDTLICNGKILMEHRVVEGEKEIIDQANIIYKRLL